MLFRRRKEIRNEMKIVEDYLNQINSLLENAKRNNLTESIKNYTCQKIAAEQILRELKR